MSTVVNKRNLFCDELNAAIISEYSRELALLRRLIRMAENAVETMEDRNTWSYEGICQLFANSVISYAKMAHDNMVLGHLNAANMVLRVLIGTACFLN